MSRPGNFILTVLNEDTPVHVDAFETEAEARTATDQVTGEWTAIWLTRIGVTRSELIREREK